MAEVMWTRSRPLHGTWLWTSREGDREELRHGCNCLLEIFQLVDFVRGFFVWMSSGVAVLTVYQTTTSGKPHFFNAATACSVISRPLQTISTLTSPTSSS